MRRLDVALFVAIHKLSYRETIYIHRQSQFCIFIFYFSSSISLPSLTHPHLTLEMCETPRFFGIIT